MAAELALKLPPPLAEEIAVISETGLYADENEFVVEAICTLLAARPDLRLAIAARLYEREAISIGKAAEISGLDIEAMKEALHKHGVSRAAPGGVSETRAMAEAAREMAGRWLGVANVILDADSRWHMQACLQGCGAQ